MMDRLDQPAGERRLFKMPNGWLMIKPVIRTGKDQFPPLPVPLFIRHSLWSLSLLQSITVTLQIDCPLRWDTVRKARGHKIDRPRKVPMRQPTTSKGFGESHW